MKKHWIYAIFISLVIFAHTTQNLLSQATPTPATPAQVSPRTSSDYWSRFKFEISTAVSFQKSLVDSSYFHQYSPPFLSGAYESLADHTIKIRGKQGWGFNIGLAYFPVTNFGVQFLVDYAKPKLSGANAEYDVRLNYSMDFDANPPYPNVFEYTYEWPETAGDFTEVGLSLNGAFRVPIFEKLAFYISGGLTYFHIDGKATGIAYSYYWWEDGWFKGRTFDVKYKIGTIDKLGLNLGAEFDWVLFSNMCFVLDVRYFACPSQTRQMTIINEGLVTPPSPSFDEITFDEIKATMNLQNLTINPSFYRINLGLKYLF
jgi:opacity protein-like surface antigen